MAEYDDSPPTHRWVYVGYAKTPGGQIDKARIGQVEHMTTADAKRLVDNNHGRYLSDDEVSELDAERGETAEAVKPAPDAPDSEPASDEPADKAVTDSGTDGPPVTPPEVPAPSGKPASLKAQGWGSKPDGKATRS